MTKIQRRSAQFFAFIISTLCLLATAKSSLAADFFWVGGSGDWNDANNWSLTDGGAPGAGVPGNGDDARVIQTGSISNVVTYTGVNPAINFLPIDAIGTGMITFSHSQDALTANDVQVGRDGAALYNQSGGSVTVGNLLLLGRNSGADGRYNFSGGTINTIGKFVGHAGTGLFQHTGGTSTVTTTLQIATQATGNGTYILSGAGSVTTSESFVGAYGHGTFIQTGGTHAVNTASGGTGSLSLGFDSGSRGVYELSGGALEVESDEYIGIVGQGTFTQTGGTHTVGRDLNLAFADRFGQDPARMAAFNLSGGSLDVGDDAFIGLDGVGVFTHTSGINTIGDRLVLGKLTTAAVAGTTADVLGNGVYNLSNGDLSSQTGEIGEFGTGTFNQTGGTYTVAGEVVLGKETSGVGTYNLSAGRLAAQATTVGRAGVGTFNQSGGTVTATTVDVATNSGSSGTYNLKGGSLTVTNTITNSGTFTFAGGALTAGLIVNDGTFVIGGGGIRLLNGEVMNNTIIKTESGTTPVFGGAFTNNGLLVNDPIFLGDAVVGPAGSFSENAGGDDYVFGRDFINESRQNLQWTTTGSVMAFVDSVDLGASGVFATQSDHDLFLPGRDLGPNQTGFVDNFAWDTLSLASGNRLTLMDGNTDIPGGALYVNILLFEDGLAQVGNVIGNGLNIYYLPGLAENAYLGGQIFNLQNGGRIAPIPLPGSVLLLLSAMMLVGVIQGARAERCRIFLRFP